MIAFICTVARNGLVDFLRRSGRNPIRQEENMDQFSREASVAAAPVETPDALVDRERFALAMVDCAGALKPVHRRAWMFRAFLDMSSKKIADHPEIRLKASHVDVVLQRCRASLRRCMQDKGFDADTVVPGTFSELWRAFRLDEMPLFKDGAN